MNYFTSLVTRALRGLTSSRCEDKSHRHFTRTGRQDRAIAHLVARGEITLADIGGNCPSKIVLRLRDQGYLKRNGAPGGERWETNPRTGCDYKVYIWTGKVPAKWVQSESYTGKDRRKKPRGNR